MRFSTQKATKIEILFCEVGVGNSISNQLANQHTQTLQLTQTHIKNADCHDAGRFVSFNYRLFPKNN